MKPIAFDKLPSNLPDERVYVGWHYRNQHGRRTKIPCTVTRPARYASVTDPSTWNDFASVRRAYEEHTVDGIGLVLADHVSITGFDLDGCRTADGQISPIAAEILRTFPSYTEWSPSERGLHDLVFGRLPGRSRQRPELAVYDNRRFLTLTGDAIATQPNRLVDHQHTLDVWYPKVFPTTPPPSREAIAPHTLDDNDLLRRAHRAGNGAWFAALWAGDWSDYPSQSEADLDLSRQLAFWTGRDEPRMDALFRRSGLMRAKWDERHGDATYGERTIAYAAATVLHTYSPDYGIRKILKSLKGWNRDR